MRYRVRRKDDGRWFDQYKLKTPPTWTTDGANCYWWTDRAEAEDVVSEIRICHDIEAEVEES